MTALLIALLLYGVYALISLYGFRAALAGLRSCGGCLTRLADWLDPDNKNNH